MKLIFGTRTVFLLVILRAYGQRPNSPCPGTFDYENDGDIVYGLIRVRANGPLSTLHIKTNFSILARLHPRNYGNLAPHGSVNLNRLKADDQVLYRVSFPIQHPLPKVTSINVNGQDICNGPSDYPVPGQTLTTISLEHTSYTSRQTGFIDYSSTFGDFPDFDSFIKKDTTSSNTFGGVWNSNTDFTNFQTVYEPPRRTTTERLPPPPPPPPRKDPVYEYINIEPPTPQPVAVPEYTPPRQNLPQVQSSNNYECGISKVLLPLILNGEEYPRGEWPWVVALFKQNGHSMIFVCSGSLVSPRHVVTAAHCMHLREMTTDVNKMVVTVGAYDLDDITDEQAKKYYVEKAVPHEAYDSFSLKNDLLVLVLKKTVIYNDYAIPVCLWGESSIDLNSIVKKRGVVTGWGTNEKHEAGRGKPRKVRVPIVSTDDCRASSPDFLTLTSDNTLCAGDRNGTGPCNGDSGGGLYMRQAGSKAYRLRGIISVSLQNQDDDDLYECNVQQYIVFTDVAKYLPWLKNVINNT